MCGDDYEQGYDYELCAELRKVLIAVIVNRNRHCPTYTDALFGLFPCMEDGGYIGMPLLGKQGDADFLDGRGGKRAYSNTKNPRCDFREQEPDTDSQQCRRTFCGPGVIRR